MKSILRLRLSIPQMEMKSLYDIALEIFLFLYYINIVRIASLWSCTYCIRKIELLGLIYLGSIIFSVLLTRKEDAFFRMVVKIKIGFIGAGAVASALGKFFSDAGYEVLYKSKHSLSAQKLADATGGLAFDCYTLFLKEADMVWITVPDDAISSVVQELFRYDLEGQHICHTSGVHSSEILLPLTLKGALTFSCHPALPFSNSSKVINAMFTVEGDTDRICELLEVAGLRYLIIDSKDKVIYHAALCIASNFMVTLAAEASNMLSGLGLTDEQISFVLFPLMEQNLQNMISFGVKNALTGPVSRGDIGTVEKHLKALEGESELYKILLDHTARLAMETERIDKKTLKLFSKLT